ncbi:phosphatase 2C-like domain-containing protein [Suillus fuscotomentosus]|uniref:Phosphatase 2C-like domain-containing protein n=1 Tax=Suillus fuscotomentosus TaxID=1912939 RepID=A0AAD4HTN8_9AGAM|nr:phosphatase 2C-like domain-containing protein [Suillus fuscotomentosus]KAG1908217.1 phosphatase 2C-like domain-containing protein [Suillus fuscotomentosus]
MQRIPSLLFQSSKVLNTTLSPSIISSHQYHDFVRFSTPGGAARVPLHSPTIIGVATSRGTRGHQEDYYAFASLLLDPDGLQAGLKKTLGIDWTPKNISDPLARQVVFVGLYDGHGGSTVSQFLRQELHGLFESVDKAHIPELYLWIKDQGGYFKRFRGGALAPWINQSNGMPPLDLEARATQAFFEVDRLLSIESEAKTCGATASVAILHSLDTRPFFSSTNLVLTVAHAGDARVLLCGTNDCLVCPMTENHHPDTLMEAARLRRMMGSSLITDSFGESRWMGALANTRALGDLKWKPYGVTPEPDVRTILLEGTKWAYMIIVSDGVSSILSDQEIVDVARGAPSPKKAAEQILSYSEELGGEDNATVIVVPLSGWKEIQGPDRTRALREYRSQQAVGSERQRRM